VIRSVAMHGNQILVTARDVTLCDLHTSEPLLTLVHRDPFPQSAVWDSAGSSALVESRVREKEQTFRRALIRVPVGRLEEELNALRLGWSSSARFLDRAPDELSD